MIVYSICNIHYYMRYDIIWYSLALKSVFFILDQFPLTSLALAGLVILGNSSSREALHRPHETSLVILLLPGRLATCEGDTSLKAQTGPAGLYFLGPQTQKTASRPFSPT